MNWEKKQVDLDGVLYVEKPPIFSVRRNEFQFVHMNVN